MHSSFCPNSDFNSKTIKISDKNELHHIKNVLRLKNKNKINIFNGHGEEATCEITQIKSKEIIVNVLKTKKSIKTGPYTILACAIPKRSKFETIIEKSTELGIDEIIPLKTDKTELRITEEKREKKIKRYNTIAINAAKQCKRLTIPKIHNITKFSLAMEYLVKNSTVLIPSLINTRKNIISTLSKLKTPDKISILIGPEGDFTDNEYKEAHLNGCIPVTLGDTILKVETAAISTVACINFFYAKNI